MMLQHRSTEQERMDTDCASFDDYRRCLTDLTRVNALTRTHRPMLTWLERQPKDDAFSVLEIACGHGDALRKIRRRYKRARLTGIDLNPWAIQVAREATPQEAAITFIQGDAFAWQPPEPFDFIISSQFTHHLTDKQIVDFLVWQQASARLGWFISDLHRHWFAYSGFPLLARVMGWHRFVRQDGQISIARAFLRSEWRTYLQAARVQADITWHLPFRLCVGTPS